MNYSVICWNLRENRFVLVKSGMPISHAKSHAGKISREKIAIICSDDEAHDVLVERIKHGYNFFYSETNLIEAPIIGISKSLSSPEKNEDMEVEDFESQTEEEEDDERDEDVLSDKIPRHVVTSGTGPYLEADFDSHLEAKGICACPFCTEDIGIVVLGRTDWDEEALENLIDQRRGKDLKVYSQEMFLAFLALGLDPYDDKQLLEKFGEGHPALEYLSDWGFDWPHTTIVPGFGPAEEDGDPLTWPQIGLLKHLKYTVGEKGLNPSERKTILKFVFNSQLPNVCSREYMIKWGKPGTGGRLKQLAVELASFAKYAKRREEPPQAAIDDWEDDLSWLKDKYYHGRFTFKWPSTYVRL